MNKVYATPPKEEVAVKNEVQETATEQENLTKSQQESQPKGSEGQAELGEVEIKKDRPLENQIAEERRKRLKAEKEREDKDRQLQELLNMQLQGQKQQKTETNEEQWVKLYQNPEAFIKNVVQKDLSELRIEQDIRGAEEIITSHPDWDQPDGEFESQIGSIISKLGIKDLPIPASKKAKIAVQYYDETKKVKVKPKAEDNSRVIRINEERTLPPSNVASKSPTRAALLEEFRRTGNNDIFMQALASEVEKARKFHEKV